MRMVLAVGLVATLWAAGFMTIHGYQNAPPAAEEANIAWHLANGHGFRSPMSSAATAPPSAWSPPIYPAVIALAYRVFGIGSRAAVTLLMWINAVCFGAVVAATFQLGSLVFGSRAAGVVAAALIAIHPLFLFYMGDFWDGMMALAMFLWLTVSALQLGRTAQAGKRAGYAGGAAFGLGLGILALTNTSYAATYPLLLFLAFPRILLRRRWTLAAVALAGLTVVVVPWTVRNYEAFGRFIPVRTGAGIQLWLGNAPVSEGWLDAHAYAFHPYVNPVERRSLLLMGEPAYNSLAIERFRRGFVDDPGGYFRRCLQRTFYLLVGEPTLPVPYPILANVEWAGIIWQNVVLNAVVAILGFGGMWAARDRGYGSRAMPLLFLLTALPFIATAVIDRYSLPLRSLLIVYAGGYLWTCLGSPRRIRSSRPSGHPLAQP